MTLRCEESTAGYVLVVGSTQPVMAISVVGWSSTPPIVDSEERQAGRDRLTELRARAHQRIVASGSEEWDQPTPADVIELRPLQFQTETWQSED